MKKLLSYLLPFTKEIPSKINGTLELTLMNGKKVLDSQNANYSYGALQKVLEYGISQIDIQNVNSTLALGLGGGSVIQSLYNKFNYKGKITAVEIDDAIINIAKDEFDIKDNKRLHIIHEDALLFVENCKTSYDLIIIDVFIDHTVPDSFYGQKFWVSINQLTKPNGYILFNAGILLKDTSKIKSLKSCLKSEISFTKHDKVEDLNTLLIGQKNSNSKL